MPPRGSSLSIKSIKGTKGSTEDNGIARWGGLKIFFTRVVSVVGPRIKVMLRTGSVIELPRKNIIRLPGGTVI